jgi:hypothetical protein
MWGCFKPQNEKNTKDFKGRYSPSSELLEQRIGQLERDAVKTRQHLDYLNTNVMALHLRTPSSITQKVEQTSAFLHSNPFYKQLMLEYNTNMDHASNVMLRKAFELNANLETQTERGVSCPGGVRFERPPLPDTTIQRASSASAIEAKEKRRFRRLDPHFDSYEGSEGI